MKLRIKLLATTFFAAIALPEMATAQGLEEIVVTARRQEESLMQVPLAISAFTSKDIEASGIKNLTDLSAVTPGLFAVNQTGGGSGRNDRSGKTIVVRGFSIAPGLIFVDGAPLNGASTPELEDVARVEVLKGPQSAYFGRATFSGAINFITKDPSLTDFQGRVKAEYSSYNSHDVSISAETPIVRDKFAVRVTLHDMFKGGQYKNAVDTSMMLGEQTTRSGSLQFVFQPSDDLKIKGYFTKFRDDDGPPAQMAMKPPADMNCNLGGTRNGGLWYCGTIPEYNAFPRGYISGQWGFDARARAILNDNIKGFPTAFDPHYLQHGGLKRDAIHADVVAEYKFADGWTFNSLTAYHWEKSAQVSNLSFRDGQSRPNTFAPPGADTRPYILWLVMVQGKSSDWSQEFRVSSPQDKRLRFQAGGNIYKFKNPGGAGVYGDTPLGTLVLSSTTRQQFSTPAFFGGAYFDITPQLTIGGEARYQWDKIEQQALTNSAGASAPGPVFKETYKSFSPRVTIDYKYADNSTAYALWSRGYRPGGFNVGLSVQPASIIAQFAALGVAGIPFKEEKLDNFEIGLKSSWLDNRARTRIAIYKELWRNGQVPVNLIFTLPSGGVNQLTAVSNVGSVDMKGAEFEAEFQVTEKFLVSGTFGYADSQIKVFTCADCLTIKGTTNGVGNRLPQAPKYQWSLSGQYDDHLAGEWDWFARVDYTHRGSMFIEYANVAVLGSKDNVNVHLGIKRENLTIQVFGKNLTRDKAAVAATLGPEALFTPATGQEIRYGLPEKRVFGAKASYTF